MYVLVTYDVSTEDKIGARRLRQVAKCCIDYGQRVQNSVFECKVDNASWISFRARLLSIVDLKKDSVRFYFLGDNWKRKIEHYGVENSVDIEGLLVV